MSEKEAKKRQGSTSKYLNHRYQWMITLKGRKPPDQRVRNEIAKLKFRSRCNLKSDTFTWEGNAAQLNFTNPISGANMKTLALKLLHDSMKDFDDNNFSFDFVFGQETRLEPAQASNGFQRTKRTGARDHAGGNDPRGITEFRFCTSRFGYSGDPDSDALQGSIHIAP